MAAMTPARLAALREAERRATPGEWIQWGPFGNIVVQESPGMVIQVADVSTVQDAALIAIARNELLALLDALERRTALLREARAHIPDACVTVTGSEPRPVPLAIAQRIDAELGDGT